MTHYWISPTWLQVNLLVNMSFWSHDFCSYIHTLRSLINGHARLFILHKNSTLPALIRDCPFIKCLKMFHPARLLGLQTFWSPPCPFIYFSNLSQKFLNFSKFCWFFPNLSECFQIFHEFFWIKIFWAFLVFRKEWISTPAHLLCTFSACPFV